MEETNLDTSKLHYVKVPDNHIVIDFDAPDKSGIHLHCTYSGMDVDGDKDFIIPEVTK